MDTQTYQNATTEQPELRHLDVISGNDPELGYHAAAWIGDELVVQVNRAASQADALRRLDELLADEIVHHTWAGGAFNVGAGTQAYHRRHTDLIVLRRIATAKLREVIRSDA